MPAELSKIPGVDVGRRRPLPARLRRRGRRDVLAPLAVAPLGRPPVRPPMSLRPRRRPMLTRDRNVPWSSLAVAGVCTAVGFYVLHAFWSATRVDVEAEGVMAGEILTSAALAERTLRFAISPTDRAHRAELELNGERVPAKAIDFEGHTLLWRPGA
ncbi:MAG TPA: hypothetical protein VM287_01880, partial [Egibacteraceae bacterium]|nr:hypothetical protein [Egibacteraceae bacterium]